MKTSRTRNFFAGLLALIAICLFGAGLITGNFAKKANAATGDTHTLTFEKTGTATVPSKSLDQYFMANAGSPAVAAYGENGAAITFTSASDKALINIGAEMGLTVGKTYIQSFKIRLEKAADAAGNFAVHPFGLHVNYSERANNKNHLYFVNGSPMWLTSASDSFGTEKTLTNKFTYDGTNNGSFVLQFNGGANSGTLYISDLTLTEDLSETRTVTTDAAIGTLPEVTAKAGYEGVWTIDGEKIAADTVYTYGADKTAVQSYTPIEYTVTFAGVEGVDPITFTVETKDGVVFPAVPEKQGYTGSWDQSVSDLELADVTVTAQYKVGKVYGASVSLNGDIAMNFYLSLSATTLADESAYVGFTFKSENTKVAISAGEQKGEYYVYSFNVAAKDYDETITLTVYATEGEGVSVSHSVKAYAAIIAAGDYSTETKALVNSLVDYCEAAKAYFAGETATEKFTEVTAESVIGYAAVTDGTLPEGVTVLGASLVLETKTAIRVYFTADNAAGVVVKVNGGTVTAKTLEQNGKTYYYVEIADIAAKDLDTAYTVEIGTFKVTYSALSYVQANITSENVAFVNVLKAMYIYNEKANAYENAQSSVQ